MYSHLLLKSSSRCERKFVLPFLLKSLSSFDLMNSFLSSVSVPNKTLLIKFEIEKFLQFTKFVSGNSGEVCGPPSKEIAV